MTRCWPDQSLRIRLKENYNKIFTIETYHRLARCTQYTRMTELMLPKISNRLREYDSQG